MSLPLYSGFPKHKFNSKGLLALNINSCRFKVTAKRIWFEYTFISFVHNSHHFLPSTELDASYWFLPIFYKALEIELKHAIDLVCPCVRGLRKMKLSHSGKNGQLIQTVHLFGKKVLILRGFCLFLFLFLFFSTCFSHWGKTEKNLNHHTVYYIGTFILLTLFTLIAWKKYTTSPRYWYTSIGQY